EGHPPSSILPGRSREQLCTSLGFPGSLCSQIHATSQEKLHDCLAHFRDSPDLRYLHRLGRIQTECRCRESSSPVCILLLLEGYCNQRVPAMRLQSASLLHLPGYDLVAQIGRASCRERV